MQTLFEQYNDAPNVKTKSIKDSLARFQVGAQKTKHEHEFQEVCSDLEPHYGKVIWTLPYKAGVTEFKIRKAHEIAMSRGIVKFGYLMGIIKKLPY